MIRSFAHYVTKYFSEYLPRHKGVSENTLRSYRDTFVQLTEYFECNLKIQCQKLSVADFTRRRVLDFLDYLEDNRNVSISTRNQRLAAIHSFFKFIQKNELSCYEQCADVLTTEFKKTPEPVIEYLKIEELRFLFSLPDVSIRRELRDLAVLTMLYETGARVQELIDLCLGDATLSSCPTVTLSGKGNKSRIVPIGSDAASILQRYIREYQIVKPSQHLFTNSQGKSLSRVGVQYIVDKYVERGRKLEPKIFTKKITNHSFRHSKSMNLLEAGVNLLYIRDFLGHTSVTTTEIYAKSNAEIKRKTIEQHSVKLDVSDKYSDTKKNELIDWLKASI